MYVDGTSNGRGSGVRVGVVLIFPKGIRLDKLHRLGFQASNNKAVYEALLIGLQVA